MTTTIANPNGLALGPGGKLYATDFGSTGDVFRVDPDSGEAMALARPSAGSNGLAFSPDYRVLYVGDHDAGVLYRLPLEADGRVAGAERWVQGIGTPDGLAVDGCGNVYAASWDRRVYQVTPAGEVRVLAELPAIVSAVGFGSGKQGWKAGSLYATALQEGGVFENRRGPRRAPTAAMTGHGARDCPGGGWPRGSLPVAGRGRTRPRAPRVCRPPEPAEIPATPAVSYRRCPLASKVGEFLVELGERFTAVSGSIAEAPVPVDVRELVAASGPCRLLRRRLLACDPACTAGMTCGEAGRCLRYPDNLDAGTVGVTGLRCQVEMRPDPVSRHYWDTTLPHPGYAPGASIRLRASGAALPPFSLAGWGVAPLVLDEGPIRLEPGQPLRVSWRPGQPGPARVQLDLDIDQHGVTPATLSCEAPDSGSFEVPADLIGMLLAAGASGYPRMRVSRQAADSADLPPGCVELIVSSAVERSLDVAGHTPCRNDLDCQTPRRCNVASQRCL